MSPKQPTMSVREFVRAGYREATEPVIVLNGGEIAGSWFPGRTGITIVMNGTHALPEPAFRPAPKPSARRK